MKFTYLSIVIILLLASCKTQSVDKAIYSSKDLKIVKVSDHVYTHITYLDTESWGRVGCNGMIVVDQNEAIIFDTPTDDRTSAELINWVQTELNAIVKAVVVTHFHTDCLGGLAEFHKNEIPSYAGELTLGFCTLKDLIVPQNSIRNKATHKIGSIEVVSQYFGPGHTPDNIVAYVPNDAVLFGGCLIKAKGAGKGNLEDAIVDAWPTTVQKIKDTYPSVKTIIPGHGDTGGVGLLDYTMTLFN